MRRPLSAFAQAMESRLKEKDALYIGWDDIPIEWLLLRLEEEMGKLKVAIVRRELDDVCEEAVDVANFAMMVYDRGIDG